MCEMLVKDQFSKHGLYMYVSALGHVMKLILCSYILLPFKITMYKYTKPPECVDIIAVHHEVSQLVPWKHESVGRVLSGHQVGKPSEYTVDYINTQG